MFTGIITTIGIIKSVEQRGDLRVTIECDFANALRIGDSVAVSGACLTVVAASAETFTVDISAESLARTAPRWRAGGRVNLERSLRYGDTLDGHMVSGHVDGVAVIKNIIESGGSHILEIEAPQELARFIAEKGSVTLDGVSLTVNKVENCRFSVNIIPHTWQITTLSDRKAGDALNLEIDMLARYVARLLEK